jgi:hypothetical protein
MIQTLGKIQSEDGRMVVIVLRVERMVLVICIVVISNVCHARSDWAA